MLLLKKPSEETIRQLINDQRSRAVSYAKVGITREAMSPPGYGVDWVEEKLGSGETTFAAAVAAFKNWEQFAVSWVKIYRDNESLEPGQVVAVLACHKLFWSLNVCRIIYTIDEPGTIVKFGFGYGTLPAHEESGEERFLLQWDRNTDIVSYDIFAFSNPSHLWGWLAYPLVRYIQNSFRRDSLRLMKGKIESLSGR